MRILVLLVAFGLSVCGTSQPLSPDIDVPLGDAFPLQVGQVAEVAGTDLVLRFDRVEEDSRCPRDVQCVWAGNAQVMLTAEAGAQEARLSLNTGVDPRAAEAGGYLVTLEGLLPIPFSERQLEPGEYIATLRVTVSR